MTIVGSVELPIVPQGATFAAELIKITDSAASKAGASAGKAFMADFQATAFKASPRAFQTIFAQADIAAGKAGSAAGKAYVLEFEKGSESGAAAAGAKVGKVYAGGFTEGVRVTTEGGQVLNAAQLTTAAEAEGVVAGRAFGSGMAAGQAEGQLGRGLASTFRGAEIGAAASGTRAAGGFVGAMSKGLVPLGTLIAGIFAVKVAADFEQETNVLVTAAGEQEKNLGKVRTGIEDIAVKTGTSWQQITKATYDADKAGYTYANGGLNVVRAASQAAREEGANLDTVTQGLTTTMINFGKSASNPVQVADALKTAAGESKTTFEEFTSGLGNFESRASAAKISLSDVLAVYSQTINSGLSAQRSAQNVGSTIQNLSGPLKPARDLMAQLGIDSVDLVQKLGDGPGGRGLAGTLDFLSEKILKSLGPSGTVLLNTFNQSKQAAAAAQTEMNALPPAAQKLAEGFEKGTVSLTQYRKQSRALPGEQGALAQQFLNTYTQAHGFQKVLQQGGPLATTYNRDLQTLTGGTQGLSVALANAGEKSAVTQDKIGKIGAAAKDTGKDVQGWAITQKNFNTEWGSFEQTAVRLGIELGTQLLPPLKSTLTFLTQHTTVIKDVAIALGVLGAAWTVLKVGSWVVGLGKAAAGFLGLGIASETAAAKIGLTSAAAQKSFLGVTGIATAASRLAGGAAIGVVASGLYEWATASSKAEASVNKIQQTITDPNSISQLETALKAQSDLYDKSHKATSGIGGLLKSTLNTVDFGLTGPSGFESIDTANKSIDALRQNQGQIDSLKVALTDLHLKFGITTNDLQALATQGGISFGSSVGSIQKGEAAFTKMYGAELKALPVNQQLANGINDTGGAASATSTKIDGLSNIVNNLLTKEAGALQATDTFHKGLNDLGDSLDQNSRTLTGNSDAAINNRAAIVNLVQSANISATAFAKSTGKADDYSKSLNFAIGQIEGVAAANGISRQSVEALIQSLGLVPKSTTSPVSLPGLLENLALAQELVRTLNNVPPQVQSQVTVYEQSVLSGNTVPLISSAVGLNTTPIHKAAGGLVPGSGTLDNVPLLGTPGEGIVTLRGMAKLGVAGLNALNDTKGSADGVHFATGGQVTSQSEVTAYLKSLAKAAAAQASAFLKTLGQVAKIGVTGIEKTVTADVKAGQAAIAKAVKEGNGPQQQAVSGRLKTAQGNLYSQGLAAVRDGVVTPIELAAVNASAKTVTDLTAQLTKLNTVNGALITKLGDYVSAEKSARDSIQSAISQNAGFSDIVKLSGTPGELIGSLTSNRSDVVTFVAKIAQLKKAGYSNAILRDVASEGIMTGSLYADMLLTATKAQVQAIDKGDASLTAAQLGAANTITKQTEGNIPGLSNAKSVTYIQTAIFQSGANVAGLVAQAEFAQRTFDSGGYLYPGQTILATSSAPAKERVLDARETADYESGRSGGVSVTEHHYYNGVDLTTAQAQSSRNLVLALRGAGLG